MKTPRKFGLWWIVAPLVLGACVQIVGIEDPLPVEGETSANSSTSTSGSGSGSSGSSGGANGPWIGWRMPNPTNSGLPNPSKYQVDMTNDIVWDQVTGLMWQRTIDDNLYTWDGAKAYCEKLVYGNHDDWRLPWRIELVSLVDYTKSNPAIDAVFPNTPSEEFWTASNYVDIPGYAWSVEFYEGDSYPPTGDSAFRVRCVR